MNNSIQSFLILTTLLISTMDAGELEYAQVGDRVTIKCPLVMNSRDYLYWKFGEVDGLELVRIRPEGIISFTSGENWKDNLALQGNSLVIKKIKKENFGTITCGKPQKISSTKVIRISVSQNSLPLLPGENLALACNVENPPKQKPTIFWVNPKGTREQGGQERVTRAAESEDNGQWTCIVKNDIDKKETNVTIKVVVLSPAPSHQYTSESSPLTLPCSIPPDISWEQLKAKLIKEVYWWFSPELPSSQTAAQQKLYVFSVEELSWKRTDQHRNLSFVYSEDKRSLSLTRELGRKDDRGEYMCVMEFDGLNVSSSVHVELLQIIASPTTDLSSGKALNLTCSLGHPLPSHLKVQWSPPKKSSQMISDPHQAHLTFSAVGTGDGGRWTCSLWHGKTRLTSAEITLKIEHKPSVWMLVIICSATVIVILLLILVLIFYQRRKRKIRHLRHRLCQCKNPKPKGFYRT